MTFLYNLRVVLERMIVGRLDAIDLLKPVFKYYDKKWEKNAKDAAEDCYEVFNELTRQVFEKYIRLNID